MDEWKRWVRKWSGRGGKAGRNRAILKTLRGQKTSLPWLPKRLERQRTWSIRVLSRALPQVVKDVLNADYECHRYVFKLILSPKAYILGQASHYTKLTRIGTHDTTTRRCFGSHAVELCFYHLLIFRKVESKGVARKTISPEPWPGTQDTIEGCHIFSVEGEVGNNDHE